MRRTRLFLTVILAAVVAVPTLWAIASGRRAADRSARQLASRELDERDGDEERDQPERERDGREGDERERERDDRERDDARERDVDRERDDDERERYRDDDDEDEGEEIGRTVRLEFRILEEEEQPTFVVLCAGGDFVIEHQAEEREFEHHINISGEIEPVGDDDDRVLIRFHVHRADYSAEEGSKSEFAAAGSASVVLGKATELTLLGDVPFSLTATASE